VTEPKPTFSVIVTSYTLGRLEDTFELLDSMKAQTYPNTEIIFVAERSEELYERVRAYANEENTPNMRVVYNDGEPGLSASRNLGIKNAHGDIIGFIDDDVLPFPDWAEEMVKTYEDNSIVGVTGPAFPLWEDESMFWFPEELYWIIGCSAWCNWDEKREVRNVWGMNMSFKKEALNLAGTFSTSIGGVQGRRLHGEEDDLSLRMRRITKKSIVYNPKVRVKHRVYGHRLTSRFIARNSYWIGYTRHMLKRLYPKGDEGKNLLDVEYQLLKRILARLFPNIFKTFFDNPIIAWRKLRVTITALLFVALGYYSHLFMGLLPSRKPTTN
jgi:glycosyltransferase involved in cell wall biosynthesis